MHDQTAANLEVSLFFEQSPDFDLPKDSRSRRSIRAMTFPVATFRLKNAHDKNEYVGFGAEFAVTQV